jgi:hypothetical protein
MKGWKQAAAVGSGVMTLATAGVLVASTTTAFYPVNDALLRELLATG